MQNTLIDSISILTNEILTSFAAYIPRLFMAILVLLIGTALAKAFRKIIVKLLEKLHITKFFEKTPVEHFLKNAELGNKIEELIGAITYWGLMLIVIHTTVSILGLTSLTVLLERIIGYLPTVISSIIILFFGLLIAGVVESLVKGSVKSVNGKSARLLGKIASYSVMVIAVLAAISELGIASEFIFIIFVGVVVTLSLGFGLAIGLGGKDLVSQALSEWHVKFKDEVSKK